MLLVVVLFFVGACSDDQKNRTNEGPPEQKTEVMEETTSLATMLETTGESRPPEVTLGNDSGGEPDVMIRLEGDPRTTFSGLCSVGAAQKVLSGQVPKRFEFDLKGQQLSCRIEKRDKKKGDLKVVLAAAASIQASCSGLSTRRMKIQVPGLQGSVVPSAVA